MILAGGQRPWVDVLLGLVREHLFPGVPEGSFPEEVEDCCPKLERRWIRWMACSFFVVRVQVYREEEEEEEDTCFIDLAVYERRRRRERSTVTTGGTYTNPNPSSSCEFE